MIAEYEAETGIDVAFTLGHIPSSTFALLMGWWSEIGIDVREQSFPQNLLIDRAHFGAPEFEMFIWRGYAGVLVDQNYLWWHSENAHPDGELSLNFGRLRDPTIDAALDKARTSSTDEDAVATAEEINRTFAEECYYYIPISWVPWAELSDSDVVGLDLLILPDGTAALVGPGANGHIWIHIVQVNSG